MLVDARLPSDEPAVRGIGIRRGVVALTALVSTVVLLAAGCSGGGSSSTGTTSSTAKGGTGATGATTTTVTVPTSTFANDTDKAKAALLTTADLPSGWTAEGTATTGATAQDATDKQLNQQLASCLGISVAELNATPPEADSPTFDSPSGNDTIDDQSQVFPTTAGASTVVDIVNSARTPSCLTRVFNGPLKSQFEQQLESGQTLKSVTGKTLSIPKYADGSGEFELSITISQSGLNITAVVDIIVIRKGRSITTLTLTQPGGESLPASLATQLASVLAGRMTP